MSSTPTYIIIAGTNKAATTSVFNYLSDHPEVCGSYIKQTNFFLEAGGTQNRVADYADGEEQYEQFFRDCAGEIPYRLEASPDYLYSTVAAERIRRFAETHPVRLVVILRHPVSRFQSWFRFAKQNGLLEPEADLQDFLRENHESVSLAYPARSAREGGNYAGHIRRFREHCPDVPIQFHFYETLTEQPGVFMSEITDSLGISGELYRDYPFKRFNATVRVRSQGVRKVYNGLRKFIHGTIYQNRVIRRVLQTPIALVQRSYRSYNTTQTNAAPSGDQQALAELHRYYQQDRDALEREIGRAVPWTYAE